MIEKATLGIQEVNVGIISIVLVSITSASVAATLMNFPIFIIIRQLTRDIEADNFALRQARLVQDTMLLHNTTDLDKPEIEKLLKDLQAEPPKETEKIARGGAQYLYGLSGKSSKRRIRRPCPDPHPSPIKKAEPKPCFFLLPRWRIGRLEMHRIGGRVFGDWRGKFGQINPFNGLFIFLGCGGAPQNSR